MNVPVEVAVPSAVVTLIFPVTAPLGTVAVIRVPEFTVKTVAFLPPKLTFDAPVNPLPVIVTGVPTGPLGGLKLVITGTTLKVCLLVSVPPGVVTTTLPLAPEVGTTAVMYVSRAPQHRLQFARSPTHVRLPQRQQRGFGFRWRLVGMPQRRPAAIIQSQRPIRLPARHNLMPGLARNAVLFTKFGHRHLLALPVPSKPHPLFHHSAHFPRRALFYKPQSLEPKCYLCPRSTLLLMSPVRTSCGADTLVRRR